MTLEAEIRALAKARDAIILAHNYTLPEVQDLADFVGDSLELSRKAAACQAKTILFCGVRFMAETAKLLSPQATVLLPNAHAGCPMADTVTPEALRAWKAKHPGVLVVAYVNTTAETKAEVDLCCTSGNARKIIESIPRERELLFVPDANFGANLMRETSRTFHLWPGCCPTHARLTPAIVEAARAEHPGARLIVHPECAPAVVALSTGGMLRDARENPATDFIVGTEVGLLHRLRQENPTKRFFPLSERVLCPNMKRTTVEDMLFALREGTTEISLPPDLIPRARKPIEAMLELC